MEEEQSEFRPWDDLIPEALGLIFSKGLSLKELLTVIPCVCKSWRNAVTAPYCWQEIDLDDWNAYNTHQFDRLLRMLVTRSSGSLRELHVSQLDDDTIFSFITENAGSLQVLRVPESNISDSIVEQTAHRLSTIMELDLSYCGIGARGLEAIGKHCKLLVHLCRNMTMYPEFDKPSDDEANAIAATMPGIKHLEMAQHLISTASAMNILSCCPQLEFLDITGCCNVKLEKGFLEENFPKLKVVIDLDESESDENLDSEDASDYYNDDMYDNYCDPCHPDYHDDDDYDFLW